MIYVKKNTAVLLVLLLAFLAASAKEIRIKGDSIVNLQANDYSEVEDPEYSVIAAGAWQAEFNHRAVTGYVAVGIDKNTLNNQFSNFSTTVEVQITYDKIVNGVFVPVVIPSRSFLISFSPEDVSRSEVIFKIEGAHKIKAIVINTPVLTAAQLYLKTEIAMDRSYAFDRTDLVPVSGVFTIAHTPDLNSNREIIDWSDVKNAVEYDFEWAHYHNHDGNLVTPGFISAGNLNLPEKVFSQASRVSTKQSEFSIPLVYDNGFIVYRVRAKGNLERDDYEGIYEGVWSDNAKTITTVEAFDDYISVSGHESDKNWNYQAVFTENGNNKYSVTYSDGSGRARQTVVNQNDLDQTVVAETFYDFQGRAAIQALPAPTESPAIKFYPEFNRSSSNTSQPYGKENFDKDIVVQTGCETATEPFSSTNSPSAGNYYSNNNPRVALNEDMYVPDAYGYPFTQTIYTPDNTGRVRSQTIPGAEFKHNNGKETKYLYTTPYQEELDQLFGSNAGFAHKYKKNVVFDANGQASVTYINPANQTVATMLSGTGGDDLTPLPYSTNLPYSVDLLSKIQLTDNYGQLEKFNFALGTRTMTRSIPVLKKGIQEFYYKIENEKFQRSCIDEENTIFNYCYDCVLDVEISLVDECGKEYLTGVYDYASNDYLLNASAGSSTNDCLPTGSYDNNWPTNITNGVPKELDPGAYALSKVVKINYEKLDLYVKDYIDRDNCLKTEEEFRIKELDELILLTDCEYDCADCDADLAKYLYVDEFTQCDPCLNAYEHAQLLKQCKAGCEEKDKCAIAFQMLLSDMSPGGQYGKTTEQTKVDYDGAIIDGGSTFEPWKFPLSIFNDNNWLPLRNLILASTGLPEGNTYKASWRRPLKVNNDGVVDDAQETNYLASDGTAYKVYVKKKADGSYEPRFVGAVISDANGLEYVYAKNLYYVEDFVKLWKPEWAELLVPYHPEFGYYQYCVIMHLSNDFDESLLSAETFTELDLAFQSSIKNSYLEFRDQLNTNFFVSIDPFFKSTSPYDYDVNELVTAFRNKLHTYAADGTEQIDIWTMAWMLGNCENPKCSANCTPPNPIVIDDASWPHFKMLYLSAKEKVMNQHRIEKVINKIHPNSPGKLLSSYNECFGNANFNKYKNDFLTTRVISAPSTGNLFSRFIRALKFKAASKITVLNMNSPYFEPSQPCSKSTYFLYAQKDPRFGNGFTGSSLNEMASEACEGIVKYGDGDCSEKTKAILKETQTMAQVQRYKQCGQCPLAYDLQVFLNGIIQSEFDLSNNTGIDVHCKIEELSAELNTSLNQGFSVGTAGPAINPNLQWVNAGTPNHLSINIGACNIEFPDLLQYPTLGISTYDQIDEICCIKAISSSQFSFTIKFSVIIGVDGNVEKREKNLIATSCLDLLNCDFGDKCSVTALGIGVQDLLNALANNEAPDNSSSINDLYALNDDVELIIDNAGNPNYYEAILDNNILDYFKNKMFATEASGITWKTTTINNTTLDGELEMNGVVYPNIPPLYESCSLSLTFESWNGVSPAVFNFSDIDYYYNLRPIPQLDPNPGSNYDFLINGRTIAGNIVKLRGISCMKAITCAPYVDLAFLTSNAYAAYEGCEKTQVFYELSEQLKAITDLQAEITIDNDDNGVYSNFIYDPNNPQSTYDLSLKIISSDFTDDFSKVKEIINTYVIKEEGNENKLFAQVQLCDDPNDSDCDGSFALVEITGNFAVLYSCEPIVRNRLNEGCTTYALIDEVKNGFM
ncbi:MAG: hypothetical protein JKY48_11860, partial [Flavobacteriales bacterium]|nr:hypothetical protein [Flavobacteriales bacterium]